MTLQTSGSISFEDIESEFGGGNPVSINDYYRGGPYVPSSITTSTVLREPSSGESYIKNNICWVKTSGRFQYTWVYWGNEKIFESTDNTLTSVVINGKTYHRDSYRETDALQTGTGGSYTMVYERFYGIHRSSGSTTTTSVNGNVPTSGQISLSDFYGGRKT
jgi:hypothetical protein